MKAVKKIGLATVLITLTQAITINAYVGKFSIFNREPYPVYIEEIVWSNCSDDTNITIPAYGKWEDEWSPIFNPDCQLEKIRLNIRDSNNYIYQNYYNSESVPYSGEITCTVNRSTQLPGGQEEPIVCYKKVKLIEGNGYSSKLSPTGH